MSIIDETTVPDGTIPGLSYRVRLVPDDDSSPDDADCYSDADKAAWHNDQWSYVGVIVTPVFAGIEFETADTSLWAVEYGTLAEVPTIDLDQLATQYPGPDLITEAREALVKLRPSLLTLTDALTTIGTPS